MTEERDVMIHRSVPALVSEHDLSNIRLVALCTETDPPYGDMLCGDTRLVTCPECRRKESAYAASKTW